MKQKTFQANNLEDLDKKVNKFIQGKIVKKTHVCLGMKGSEMILIENILYTTHYFE